MITLKNTYDLDDYIGFIQGQIFANNTLEHYISDVQRIYRQDKRPWVIGYSGGKDSSAVVTLVYLSLLGLTPEQRHKPVFVISSDTLVETPVVVEHINQTLAGIERGAKKDGLPITSHKVTPLTKETFWSCLLGKGYPAPTQTFRWCTERMKINPVSDFIKNKISHFDEVVVLLGSRSDESSSRAQVIAKHKIDGTRLARHTTLDNAFIYTPIDTWDTNDVWTLLRGAFQFNPQDVQEWESPWGGNNRPLWTLYMDSSGDQGECPLVIDSSTPSCGNSRFGCWTCTVVSKDRAMESLIKHGEQWMEPLLLFRNELSKSNIPANKNDYRNFKRRIGKVSFQRAKKGDDINSVRSHVPGAYWLHVRQRWLRELLTIEKKMRDQGHDITLITQGELHNIRQEWLNDPNEPDWDDSLPNIYREVTGKDLPWVHNDNNTFSSDDLMVLREAANQTNTPHHMVMKLLDVEISMEGLSRRSTIKNKLTNVLKQDWGSLETIIKRQAGQQTKIEYDLFQEDIELLEQQLLQIAKLTGKGDLTC